MYPVISLLKQVKTLILNIYTGCRTLTNEELRVGIANYTGKPLDDKDLNDVIKQVRRDITQSHMFTQRLLNVLYAPSIGASPKRTPNSVRRMKSTGSNS